MSVFYSTVPQSLSSAPIAYATTSLNSSTAVESTNLCPGKRARELEQGETERHYAGITHANGIAAENTSIAADEREFKRLRRAFERDSLSPESNSSVATPVSYSPPATDPLADDGSDNKNDFYRHQQLSVTSVTTVQQRSSNKKHLMRISTRDLGEMEIDESPVGVRLLETPRDIADNHCNYARINAVLREAFLMRRNSNSD